MLKKDRIGGTHPPEAMFRCILITVLLVIAVLTAGCTFPSGVISDNNSAGPALSGASAGTANPHQDPLPDPVFPVDPVPLSGSFRPSLPLSSFEDSFIGSYGCTEDSETYSTNFTLITGEGGPQRIKYTVVPVTYYNNLTEIPLSADIISAVIEPDEFIAEPSTVHTSRFTVTIGPNVTGESGNMGDGAVWMKNPSYSFLVKVSADGSDMPGLSDAVNVRKWCDMHSQTRDMQGIPSWELESHEIAIRAGEKKAVNLSLRNFGGGIRQIEFRVPARLKGPGFTFPLETEPGQLLPIPEGIGFAFAKPVMNGRNFQQDSNQLIISTNAETPPGSYRFPLELCYRDMDLENRSSQYYPFGEKLLCPGCGDFTLTIISGDLPSPAPASAPPLQRPAYTSVTPAVVPVSTISRTPSVTPAKQTATPAPSDPFDLKADFSPTSTEGVTPYTVRFHDRSTGSPASWYWDFDDGNFSTEQSPAHTFVSVTEPDTLKHVTLTIRKGSDISTRTRDILVHPPYSVPDFTASVTDGPAPLLVMFHDTSTGAPAVADWKFGDGTYTYETNPQHLYAVKGTYIVTLTRTTPWGARSKNMTITVR